MKTLIIAAGEGSRLGKHTADKPKPLVPLAGKPLLEHLFSRLKKAGLREIVLVIGYKGNMLREYFGDGSSWGMQIEYVENPQWRRGNGLSVLCGKKYLSSPFFLLMSDHLFDFTIVEEMKKSLLPEGAVILGVDTCLHPHSSFVDLEDVTKVHLQDDKLLSIGKELTSYNAFDTGIFYCTPAFFPALEESVARGDESISGGMRILAAQGKALSFNIGKKSWIDVDSQEFLEKAEVHFCGEANSL